MEHLLLDVAAAPLRLIAAKNEKSRSELGRFLTKQVRTRARGKMPGRQGPVSSCPAHLRGYSLLSRGERSGVLSRWPSPQGWPVADASMRV